MRVLAGFAGVMALVYAGLGAAAPAEAKPDVARGKQIASTVCVACHAADGNSTIPANPVLAGQSGSYIATQLALFKSGARPSPVMMGMATSLSPEDMRAVGAWFEQQKPAERVARDKALADRGAQIWRGGIKAQGVPPCAGCHGAAGHGIPAQFPRLAGQYPELTLGWLKAYADGSRPQVVMGPIAQRLGEKDMRAVAEYTAGLR